MLQIKSLLTRIRIGCSPINEKFDVRVEITKPPGIFADGTLKRVIAEQGAPCPHLVIEMEVDGISDPVKITLDELDLFTIVRLAKGSSVPRIRDTVA